jgi:hypothetical protein
MRPQAAAVEGWDPGMAAERDGGGGDEANRRRREESGGEHGGLAARG